MQSRLIGDLLLLSIALHSLLFDSLSSASVILRRDTSSTNSTLVPDSNSTSTKSAVDHVSQDGNRGTGESDDDCVKRKLSTQLWFDLEMNEYIKNYPHGNSVSLKVS